MGNIPGGNFPQGQGHGPFGPQSPFGQQGLGQQGFGAQQGPFHGYPPGAPPQANVTPPPYGQPGPNNASPGYPPQGYPPQGYSPQDHPPQGYPPQGYPTQGYPSQGSPPQGYPPQGYLPQGYPQGPPGSYPGRGPQSGMGEAACCASCAACLTCLLCSCCNALMGSGMHNEGEVDGLPPAGASVSPPAVSQTHDDHDDD